MYFQTPGCSLITPKGTEQAGCDSRSFPAQDCFESWLTHWSLALREGDVASQLLLLLSPGVSPALSKV